MKKYLLALLLLAPPASADVGIRYVPVPCASPCTTPQQTVTGTAAGIANIPPGNPGAVLVTVETANIRWRDDGTAPTASVGQPVASGTSFWYTGTLSAIQFIAVSGSPVLDFSFYK